MATYESIAYDFTPDTADQGAIKLIKSIDASSDSTISFVDGTSSVVLDNTYRTYIFKFINIHPSDDIRKLLFQGNAAGGSGYNETITSASFYAYHDEADSEAAVSYYSGGHQAQGTSFQRLVAGSCGNDNDQHTTGELWLFNPSSTTFATHFLARTTLNQDNDGFNDFYVSGYFNTTSAIDEIQFKMDSNDIDTGTFKLYGIV